MDRYDLRRKLLALADDAIGRTWLLSADTRLIARGLWQVYESDDVVVDHLLDVVNRLTPKREDMTATSAATVVPLAVIIAGVQLLLWLLRRSREARAEMSVVDEDADELEKALKEWSELIAIDKHGNG